MKDKLYLETSVARFWFQNRKTMCNFSPCKNKRNDGGNHRPFMFGFFKSSDREKKLAENGNFISQHLMGNRYYFGLDGVAVDYAEAVKWWRKAAEQNFTNAQYNLGVCYEKGQGVTQDYVEAVKWYRKAADSGSVVGGQGSADAQHDLGWCYYDGRGVPQDYTEAAKWWRKAAEQGHANAQCSLGW